MLKIYYHEKKQRKVIVQAKDGHTCSVKDMIVFKSVFHGILHSKFLCPMILLL